MQDVAPELGEAGVVPAAKAYRTDVAEALAPQGFTVEKSQVRLPNGPLKMVGDYTVGVSLHTDVAVDVNVSVQGESV